MKMDNSINIDFTPSMDGRTSLGNKPSDILNAREEIARRNQNYNSILNQTKSNIENTGFNTAKVAEVSKAFDDLLKTIQQQIKTGDENQKRQAEFAKEILSSVKAQISFNKLMKDSAESLAILENAQEVNAENYKDLTRAMSDVQYSMESLGQIEDVVDKVQESLNDLTKTTKETAINTFNNFQIASKRERDARERAAKDYEVFAKTSIKDLKESLKTEVGKLGDSLSQLLNTWNINKLASQLAPSSKQLLQGNLQTTYGLTSSEFDSFKKDLYDQVDGTNYTNEEILQAMEALNTTALGSTKTATAYFKDLIRGQKVLGMSAQTQQELLKLGNLTGRNELTFYQNQVAKYLNSSLGLNKQQLDQLVNLNASLQTQAADIGIATEAFETMSMNESAAFEATNTGSGAKYTQAISSLLANTDTAAALLGMDSGELSARLSRGESFIDLLRNGMGSQAALNVLRNGTAEEQTRYYEHASAAWGVDKNTWSVLRLIAQQSEELNKNLSTATVASQQNGEDAMETLEEKQYESLNSIQKAVNDIQKWFNKNIPWQILQTLTSIGVGVATLISTWKIIGNMREIFGGLGKLLGGGGTATDVATIANGGQGGGSWLGNLGTLLGGKGLIGKLGITKTSWGKLGGVAKAAGVGGIITAGIDGWNMQDSAKWSGNEIVDKATGFGRGALLGTGHSEQSGWEKAGSIAGNALKGAAIGSFFGPVGTGIGALIGGGLGFLGTLFGSSSEEEETEEEKRRKREEADRKQNLEYLESIKNNTYTTALNTTRSGMGMVYRYRGYSNYSSGFGGPSNAGDVDGIPYNISSNYGPRKSFQTTNGNWTNPFHSGTDFKAPEGTPLYSNVTGTVLAAGKDSVGANYVGITDDRTGYTHWYWHMMKAAEVVAGQKVKQGQLVGYVGHTGNVTGDHLHFSVTKPGATKVGQSTTVDPLPFATASIFSGNTNVLTSGTDTVLDTGLLGGLRTNKTTRLSLNAIGDIAQPIINSIGDLKQTIIDLSDRTSRNEKIMNALVNKTMQSPIV